MLELLEKLRADQFDRWQSGERMTAETYIEKNATVRDDPEAAVDLIYSEILLRERLGETIDLTDYRRRFPHYADALDRQLRLHDLFRPDLLGDAHPLTQYPLPADLGISDDRQRTLPHKPRDAGDDPAFWPDIPGFTIQAKVGSGGYGVVYRARQRSLNRTVALKVLHHPAMPEPEELALFRNEAEAVAQLHHPHIVQVHDFGEHQGRPYCVMEYVDGGSLSGRLAGKPLPPREAADLIATLAEAIHTAHVRGIVHRDLKPANILMGAGGVAKIADFGLAKRADAEVSLIKSGAVVGTPTYMAPEQACGRSKLVGPATDVYALGAILYQALTGRVPFKGDSLLDQLEQVKSKPPVPPRRLQAELPRPLEIICLKCLEKEPGRRYASAAALADDLRRFLDEKPIVAKPDPWLVHLVRRRPVLTTALAVAVAVGLLLGGYYATAEDPEKAIHRQLDKEGRYTFIGDGGPPKVMHWPIAPGTVVKPREDSEGFTFECVSLCPLELLSDPGSANYVFRARVRHVQSAHGGKAGIFFGLQRIPTAKGDLFCFCELAVSDWTPPVLPQAETVPIHLFFSVFRDPDELSKRIAVGKALQYQPAIRMGDSKPWRDFRIEVTPASVRSFLDGQLISEVTRAELSAIVRSFRQRNAALADINIDFRPTGGLGLFVHNGTASVQDVVIETAVGPNEQP